MVQPTVANQTNWDVVCKDENYSSTKETSEGSSEARNL
jgi:hypothetical protein